MLKELAIAKILEGLGQKSLPKPKINLITAIGTKGQIGLHGQLPWADRTIWDSVVKADLKQFQELTSGAVVVVGRNTWPSVATLDHTHDRLFLIDGADTIVSGFELQWDFEIPSIVAGNRASRHDYLKNEVWIAGGAKTYAKWLPYVDEIYVSYIEYDGYADTYFPLSEDELKQRGAKTIVDWRHPTQRLMKVLR